MTPTPGGVAEPPSSTEAEAPASQADATGTDKTPSLRWARYEVLAVTLIICGLQLTLPDVVTLGQWWVGWPIVEVPWALWVFFVLRRESNWTKPSVRRATSGLLILMATAVTFNSVMLLSLLFNNSNPTGTRLLFAGFAVVTMNILVFGLIYWWSDSGGPIARAREEVDAQDLLFPQQTGELAEQDPQWQPRPADYLYTAYTNVFAFSPTDTMPLTLRTKALFTVQSGVALMTITVTLGLAVNLLN
jgi:hypothetical protein